MSIQFAGSKSQDDRRRRRLVVNADDPVDDSVIDEGTSGRGVASELVASSAAAPWVPVYEWRIWTYASLIGLLVSGAAFALTRPHAFRPELAPLTQHLLQGDRPVLAVLIQTAFCFLAAQLSILIGWYRVQCKLDFRGLYRVWAWAAAFFLAMSVCSATGIHLIFGQIIDQADLLPWRGATVSWLLPTCLASMFLMLRLDRDVRRGRSSLYTLRVGWLLGVVAASGELFASDLEPYPWASPTRIILPMFVAGLMFVGLWLHARVVAYICPDPPEAEERTIWSQLSMGWTWVASLTFWRRRAAESVVEVAKPKRTRKKAAGEEDDSEAAPKRKRRTPAKRVSKPRTRKAPEVEEEVEEEQDTSYTDESTESDSYSDSGSDSNEWEEQETDPEPEPTPSPRGRDSDVSRGSPSNSYGSSSSQQSHSKPQTSDWEDSEQASADSEDGEDSEDAILRRDTGMTAEQMKGLSKRQKRELRRQARDQQRNQRR